MMNHSLLSYLLSQFMLAHMYYMYFTTVYDRYFYSLGPSICMGTTIQKVNSNWLDRYL